MNEIAKHLLTTLGPTGLIVAGVSWWFKSYIDAKLASQQKSVDQMNQMAIELRKAHDQQRDEVLQKLLQTSTRARNSLRDILKAAPTASIGTLQDSYDELESYLYGAELLIPLSTWNVLHQYKRAIQPLLFILADATTDNLSDKTKEKLGDLLPRIEKLHNQLQLLVREDFAHLETPRA